MEISIGYEDMAAVLSDKIRLITNLELQIAALKRIIIEQDPEQDNSSEEKEEDADSGEG
jgi:hypothetical protein